MKTAEPVYIIPQAFFRDAVVVITSTWLVTLYSALDYGMELGRDEPKVCARVPGEQVISSTISRCTYANSYGRATRSRRAI